MVMPVHTFYYKIVLINFLIILLSTQQACAISYTNFDLCADNIVVNQQKNFVELKGHVILMAKELVISADEIKIVLSGKGPKQKVSQILINSGFKALNRKTKDVVIAKKVSYDATKGLAIISDGAYILRGEIASFSNQITYNFADEQALLTAEEKINIMISLAEDRIKK